MTRTPIHLRTFAAGAAFTLLCVAGGALANPTPDRHGVAGGVTSAKPLKASSGPSVADQLAALRKRVDTLQVREADTRKTAQSAASTAWDAANVTDCIVDAIYITFDDEGNAVSSDASDDADAIPTLDPTCLEGDAS